MKKPFIPEILAPAGDKERLVTAIEYGADAVYLGSDCFGMRTAAASFGGDALKEACDYAHARGVKVYLTCNTVPRNNEIALLPSFLDYAKDCGIDALIVTDIGVLEIIKKQLPDMEIHISTQANNTNYETYRFWWELGAKRVVSARELSLAEIRQIRDRIPEEMEIESFIHGAMCISYSGRCLLSNYIANRDSNKGACAQACRWCYTVTEQSRQGEHYPVEEDSRGTYIFNSKDLCLIKHIDKLIDAGIDSFKIEGRMKSQYYVANVTNAYRRAIDSYYICEDKSQWVLPKNLEEETVKSSHRHYTTGFYFGEKTKEKIDTSAPTQTYKFIAIVLQDEKDGFALIEQRNRFKKGDVLQVLSSGNNFNKELVVEYMKDENGEEICDAKNVNQKIWIKTNLKLKKSEILRIKV